jgi:small subunit ribosomal protein S9
MTTTKSTTTAAKSAKTAAPKLPRKPRATTVKKTVDETVAHKTEAKHVAHEPKVVLTAPSLNGKYVFATGRRKTAIANVRLFEGEGKSLVNKKPFKEFFGYNFHFEEVSKAFDLTGTGGKYYFSAHINGGGPHAQATALRLGIAGALGKISEEMRKVLKKNGLLTRDDRKKERKKPGLKRARRSPQWAKR